MPRVAISGRMKVSRRGGGRGGMGSFFASRARPALTLPAILVAVGDSNSGGNCGNNPATTDRNPSYFWSSASSQVTGYLDPSKVKPLSDINESPEGSGLCQNIGGNNYPAWNANIMLGSSSADQLAGDPSYTPDPKPSFEEFCELSVARGATVVAYLGGSDFQTNVAMTAAQRIANVSAMQNIARNRGLVFACFDGIPYGLYTLWDDDSETKFRQFRDWLLSDGVAQGIVAVEVAEDLCAAGSGLKTSDGPGDANYQSNIAAAYQSSIAGEIHINAAANAILAAALQAALEAIAE